MRTVVSLAVAALLGCTAASNNSGLGFSVSQTGIDQGKDQAIPIIFQNLGTLSIPEVDFSGGNLHNILVTVAQPNVNDVQVVLDNTQNGIEVKASNIQVAMTSDFKFKKVITVDGKADINIKSVGIDFEFDLATQPGTPSTELAPYLTVAKTTVNLNPDDVDIKLSGSLVSKIADLLIPLIKSSVLPTIVSQV
jgi:hypothetical protein